MNNVWEYLQPHKKILILGFGREGQSTYSFIRQNDQNRLLYVADINEKVKNNPLVKNDSNIKFITGESYLNGLTAYDYIIKTPGISLSSNIARVLKGRLASQTELFINIYRMQIIGVTGTKGKSTTASFICHALKHGGFPAVLLGNIGIPPFDMLSEISSGTKIVYEFSSHMLQGISASPHIALLLNIFPEHLDYYPTFSDYADAKAQIFKYQQEGDILITDKSSIIEELIKKHGTQAQVITFDSSPSDKYPYVPNETSFSDPSIKTSLVGLHVLHNIALGAAASCYAGLDPILLSGALQTFHGLPHRLETIGTWKGITFIDDSISTIPESAIMALRAFPKTAILIIGGMDRGISYLKLIEEVLNYPELNVFCLSDTGKKIYNELKMQARAEQYFYFEELTSAVAKCYELLAGREGTVVFSPASASYNQYKNFEERGEIFKNLVQKYGTQ